MPISEIALHQHSNDKSPFGLFEVTDRYEGREKENCCFRVSTSTFRRGSTGYSDRYSLITTTGTFSVEDFVVSEMLNLPEGTTHVSLSNAVGRVDFTTGEFATSVSPKTNLAVSDPAQPISLAPAALPTGNGFLFFYLLLEFFQEVNGTQYPLKNHAHNVLCLLEVTDAI